jgi:hypothetical protein
MNKLALIGAAALTSVFMVGGAAFAQAGGDFAKADGNTDGKVTFEEAVGVYPTLTQELFDQADANKDAALDETEYGSLAGLVGQPSGDAGATSSSSAAQ